MSFNISTGIFLIFNFRKANTSIKILLDSGKSEIVLHKLLH